MATKLLVTGTRKKEIIDALKGADPILAAQIKKKLPSKCFINGNSSALNWKEIDKFIQSNEDDTFSDSVYGKFIGKISQLPNSEEQYVAAEILSAITYNVHFSYKSNVLKDVFNKADLKMPKGKKACLENEELVSGVAKKLGIEPFKAAMALSNAKNNKMATQMIENLCANVSAKIAASKSKKVAAKEVVILADPTLKQIKAYGKDSKYRPDIVIQYKDGKEPAYLMSEHFGWSGSASYIAKQSQKLRYAAENGIPFFYSAPNADFVEMLEVPDTASSLEKSVYNWNKSNFFVADNEMDAVYMEMYEMLSYIGLEKFMPSMKEAFTI